MTGHNNAKSEAEMQRRMNAVMLDYSEAKK